MDPWQSGWGLVACSTWSLAASPHCGHLCIHASTLPIFLEKTPKNLTVYSKERKEGKTLEFHRRHERKVKKHKEKQSACEAIAGIGSEKRELEPLSKR